MLQLYQSWEILTMGSLVTDHQSTWTLIARVVSLGAMGGFGRVEMI